MARMFSSLSTDAERRAAPEMVGKPARPTPADAYPTDLDSLYEWMAPRFSRSEVRSRLRRYIAGLMGYVDRKNCWRLAEYAGEKTPDGMQRLLSTARWDADAVRDDLRDYVVARLSDSRAVLSIAEIGFRRRGRKSAGVKRQLNPCSGRTDNCQVGVFLAFVSPTGQAFVDRELYLPEEWVGDAKRREDALVPESIRYSTKPHLALHMLRRASGAGVEASWVTSPRGYGGDVELRAWLEGRRQPYALGVGRDHMLLSESDPRQFRTAAQLIDAATSSSTHHEPVNVLEDATVHDWTLVPLAAQIEPGWRRWLLARPIPGAPSDTTYHVVFAPARTTPSEMVRAAALQRGVRESATAAKVGAGLDGYEVRHWDGWYRHVTLSLLAHAFLVLGLSEPGGNGKE